MLEYLGSLALTILTPSLTTRVLKNPCTEVLNFEFNVIFMSKHVLYTYTFFSLCIIVH